MEDLSTVLDLGALAALVLVLLISFRMLARGDFVPKRELEYVRADRDARLAEKDEEISSWRSAHETSEAARELLNQQNRDLADGFRTFQHFFDSLRTLVEKGGPSHVRLERQD